MKITLSKSQWGNIGVQTENTVKTASRNANEGYWFALALISRRNLDVDSAISFVGKKIQLGEADREWLKSQLEQRVKKGPISEEEFPTAWKKAMSKPQIKKESQITTDDGLSDGGERYTNDELDMMEAEFPVYPATFSGQGVTGIWYWKKELAMSALSNFQNDFFFNVVRNNTHLDETHAHLGDIRLTDLEDIYRTMQGEIWSPNGEAKELIQEKGVGHTSMSIGDVVVLQDGSRHMVYANGFKEIK
jgi:hypothetical protein